MLELNFTEKSITSFKNCIEIDHNFKNAYYKIGVAYSDIGETDLSIKNLNKAIDIDPNFTRAILMRAYVYKESANYRKALSDTNKVLKLDPEHPYSFWIDLWGEDLLACCEGTQEDQHPRAVGIREWQLKLKQQEEDYEAWRKKRLSELSEEEESEEEQEDLVPNKKRKALI